MAAITPFGTGNTSDVPIQKFMGATVSTFNCGIDYASQPGSCNIVLVQDDVNGDLFVPGVIGSPQFFKILDSAGSTVFQFNGILESISRNTSAGSKTYNVTLISPLKVLDSVTVILDGYTGYGSTKEGLPRYYSEDGYYTISEADKQAGYLPDGVSMTPSVDYFELAQYSFASNNANLQHTGMWNRVYNLLNVFGYWENESISATNFSGFGSSSVVNGQMRFDKVAYALNELINNTDASSSLRYLGGNLLFGSNTYNVCSTAAGYTPPNPYWYGLDILDFATRVIYKLPENFLLTGPSMSLLEIVSSVCDAINYDFMVELNTTDYDNGLFFANLKKTYPLSIFGGIISITLIPKNEYVSCDRPFSQFTYDLINLEKPDAGDYGFSGNVNPGQFVPAVGFATNNPLDQDYAFRGSEGSYPYGGRFPASIPADSRGTSYSISNRAEKIDVSLKLSAATTGKMVTGGFQSRMNVVPRDFIYHYWGEITFVDKAIDSCGINRTSQKSIPVITQLLPPNDTWDWVAIDMQDLFGKSDVLGILYGGVYFASMMEIRSAMASYSDWDKFIRKFKKIKSDILDKDDLFSTLNGATTALYPSQINEFQKTWAEFGGVQPGSTEFKTSGESYDSIKRRLHEKIKAIGDTHYGKSWVCPLPLYRTKITSDHETIIGNIVKTWDISESAYVEPYLFSTIEAPKDSRFMDGGRLRAFANFEHSFSGDGDIGYDPTTNQMTGFISGLTYKYDFSDHGSSVTFDFNPDGESGVCPLIGLAHTDVSIEHKPILISPSYFSYYNRGHCPFIDNVDSLGVLHTQFGDLSQEYFMYSYDYPKKGTQTLQEIDGPDKFHGYNNLPDLYESTLNDPNNKTFFNPNQLWYSASPLDSVFGYRYIKTDSPKVYGNDRVYYPVSSLFPKTVSSGFANYTIWETTGKIKAIGTSPLDMPNDTFFSWNCAGTALGLILGGILSFEGNDTGNGLPFVKFSTNRVYYPSTINSDGYNAITGEFLRKLEEDLIRNKIPKVIRGAKKIVVPRNNAGAVVGYHPDIAKACVAPRSIGIPQQSNRYTYGPWITNTTNIIYAGKMEYEQNLDLVPENFIIPVYGSTQINWRVKKPDGTYDRTIDNIEGTVLSGMAGVNLAGQAIANSIDGFSLFANEEGSITIPGLPLITKLGQFLLNGPRITDLNLTFSGNTINTTYNFRSISPRYGKTNKDIIQSIRKLANTVRSSMNRNRNV